MERRKKMISALLVFIMMLSIVGCGNSVPAVNDNVADNSTEEMGGETVDKITATEQPDATKPPVIAEPESTAAVEPTATPEPTAAPTSTPEPTPTPHVHQWSETVTRTAGCNVEGEKKLTCECGENKLESIPPTGSHNWEPVYQTVTHPGTGHVEERETQVQTGTSDGYTIYSCGICGVSYDTPSDVSNHCKEFIGVDNDHAVARTVMTDYPGQPVYETRTESVWVVDTPETTTQELVGYTCSECGATK